MNSLVESIGKSEFRIMYNNTLCEFIPSPNCSLDEIPDTVKGSYTMKISIEIIFYFFHKFFIQEFKKK